jgi:hypothetical protein
MFEFQNLTEAVRGCMVAEVERDTLQAALYVSDRLSAQGRVDYPRLLREAVAFYDPQWLADRLGECGRINPTEVRRYKGVPKVVKTASNAAEMLADGEYNRFYIRGLCLFVLEGSPDAELEIYRGKPVSHPRPESQARIGRRVRAADLLNDLRSSVGVDTALGVPAGPNSGLSVRIPA